MGTTKEVKDYEIEVLKKLGGYKSGLTWCEFGNQIDTEKVSEKRKLTNLGIHHTSFDLNGKDGALKVNLDLPLPEKFIERFDVATNYGTIEHINNQYMAFKNFHDCVKIGGIMIHGFPMKGFWIGHCRYYYTTEFVKDLARVANYKVIDLRVIDYGYFKGKPMVYCFLKKLDKNFINLAEFNKLAIFDSGDDGRTGHYESIYNRLKNRIKKYI